MVQLSSTRIFNKYSLCLILVLIIILLTSFTTLYLMFHKQAEGVVCPKMISIVLTKIGFVENWQVLADVPFVFRVVDKEGNLASYSWLIIEYGRSSVTQQTDHTGFATIAFDKKKLNKDPKVKNLRTFSLRLSQVVSNTQEGSERKGLIMETNNFMIYYWESETQYLQELIENLEDNYLRIVKSLGMEGELPKITIRIYPTITEFHRAVNMEGAPNWALGTISGKHEFSMASPMSPNLPVSYEDMVHKLPLHEFTHVVVYNLINPENIPYWLWEGISLYMADQRVDLSKVNGLKKGNFPEYEELSSMQYSFQFGYSLIEFIAERWGIETLKVLLLSNGNIEDTYHISIETFYQKWQDFVLNNYFR